MNKYYDFTRLDGIGLSQDALEFMQSSYRDAIGAMATAFGQNKILTGVDTSGANTSSGWVIMNGQLLPFVGGLTAPYVYVDTVTGDELFGDGSTRTVQFTKVVRMTSVQGTNVALADLKPHRTDALNVADSEIVASAMAVKTLKDALDTQVAALQALIDGIGFAGKGTVNIGDVNPADMFVTVTHNLNIQVPYTAVVTLVGVNSNPNQDNDVIVSTTNYQANSFVIGFRDMALVVQNVKVNYLLFKL